jgi:LAS superfamily LD-carboxypeptidase LdcB
MSEVTKPHREITVITKSESPREDAWSTFERISKVISIAAIPIVLAVGGWLIQRQLQNQTVSRDYVQLAISILEEPDQKKVPRDMREYAVSLLQANSPIKITPELAEKLKSGTTVIPSQRDDLILPRSQPTTNDTTGQQPGVAGNPKSQSEQNPLAGMQPAVANLALKLVDEARKKGIEVRITRGYVSFERQKALWDAYLRGEIPAAVSPSESPHVKGLAFDVIITEGERPVTSDEKYYQLAEIAKQLGLTWGADNGGSLAYHFEYKPQNQ